MSSNLLEDRWLNVREAAAYLGYKPQTLYNKVGAGEIAPDARLGRTLRFRKSSLDHWVEEQNAAAQGVA